MPTPSDGRLQLPAAAVGPQDRTPTWSSWGGRSRSLGRGAAQGNARPHRSWQVGSTDASFSMEVPDVPPVAAPPPPSAASPAPAAAVAPPPPAVKPRRRGTKPGVRQASAEPAALQGCAGGDGSEGAGTEAGDRTAPLEEGFRRAADEVSERLCRRIDHMEESLERSIERTLAATIARVLGAEGPEHPSKAARGLHVIVPEEQRRSPEKHSAWMKGLQDAAPAVGGSPSACGGGRRPAESCAAANAGDGEAFCASAPNQLTPGSGCTAETDANEAATKSGERTEPDTPCSTGSAVGTLPDLPRASTGSAPARVAVAAGAGLLSRALPQSLAERRGQIHQPPPFRAAMPTAGEDSTNVVAMAYDSETGRSEGDDTALAYLRNKPLPLVLCARDEDEPAPEFTKEEHGSLDRKSETSCTHRNTGEEARGRGSRRSSETSVAPGMWPFWCGPDVDVCESGPLCAQAPTLSREVDIRVRLSEMEAKGFSTSGSFLDTPADFGTCNFGGRQSMIKSSSRLQGLILHPTSNPILVWHIIGPFLLAYDIVTIPMKAFPIPEHWAFDVIAIIVTAYWSMDTIRGFFTGFEMDNTVEMRPEKIARRYLRSWFVLDAMTCTLDWAFIIGGSGGMFNKFWRTSRAVQAWRILRLVRLVRVVKFVNRVTAVVDQVLSLQVLIAIKSIYIAMAVGFFCHYMACYWFLVGDYNMPANLMGATDTQSWLVEYKLENASLSELYTISFHWALAQSGFAPSNIYPTNNAERTYASCASFLWLIIVSVTINLFAMWLSQLRETNKDRETQRINLRKYLEEHEVSRKLTYKVLRCFRANYKAHMRRVHETDIEFLRDLPLPLKVSLHKEVYLPVLKSHIFFQFLGKVCESMPVMISHLAVTEAHYLAGETVFREGQPAKEMLYIQIGRLDYYAVRQNMRVTKLSHGEWACEPALWLRWVLRGRLVTSCSSNLVGVDVERVQAIIQDARARGEDVAPMRKYATEICEHFMQCCPNTDLWRDFETMQLAAEKVYRSMEYRTMG